MMHDKICVVTGANSGIGKETARALARMGAHVIMVCRDPLRGRAALEDIQRTTGSERLDLMLADLSVQQDIHDLSAHIHERVDRVDVLVNNAGAIFKERFETPDGLELTFALNHMGYFLLTNLLIDLLIEAAPSSRIISVSSDAHLTGGLRFDDLQFTRRHYNSWRAYGASKLANILFTRELAWRVKEHGITANAMHPGVVSTNFGTGAVAQLALAAARPVMRTPLQGAQTAIYLASSPEVEYLSGEYFYDCKIRRTSLEAQKVSNGKHLWDVSCRLSGLDLDHLPRP